MNASFCSNVTLAAGGLAGGGGGALAQAEKPGTTINMANSVDNVAPGFLHNVAESLVDNVAQGFNPAIGGRIIRPEP